jgi:hypothetical protein
MGSNGMVLINLNGTDGLVVIMEWSLSPRGSRMPRSPRQSRDELMRLHFLIFAKPGPPTPSSKKSAGATPSAGAFAFTFLPSLPFYPLPLPFAFLRFSHHATVTFH